MKRFQAGTLAFATAVVAFSGLAMAQEQSQGVKLIAGNTELIRALSTKSATQGQAVAVKLTGTIKTAEGVELPRGTELLGRVDEVKASDNKGPSTLTLTFYQAHLKDGKTIAIKATVAAFAAAGDTEQLPAAVDPHATFDQVAGGATGVALHSSVQDKSSATFTDSRSNISLGAGTQLLVAVGAQSAQASTSAE
ncbi:hypothetical protein HNQ77_003590 [Silvibacterium bohemicum]|uniref:DUF5666 domain-containing protein n=1 Tax=Silvibacterium bohemicum TaxID=1577686 RepID=A0A841K0Z4_9BACT|nr:hypothetical protein [Silvibacterium bohemicum]MBB6145629.1 hypothetical protein [Silvibacterium bohemicum]